MSWKLFSLVSPLYAVLLSLRPRQKDVLVTFSETVLFWEQSHPVFEEKGYNQNIVQRSLIRSFSLRWLAASLRPRQFKDVFTFPEFKVCELSPADWACCSTSSPICLRTFATCAMKLLLRLGKERFDTAFLLPGWFWGEDCEPEGSCSCSSGLPTKGDTRRLFGAGFQPMFV